MSSTRSNTSLRTVTTVISLAVALCVVVAALILTHTSGAQTTAWALLAPVIAIALALITKEVYSSLFIGIVIGSLLYARSDPATALNTIVGKGLASAAADSARYFYFPGYTGHYRMYGQPLGRIPCLWALGTEAYPHPRGCPPSQPFFWA